MTTGGVNRIETWLRFNEHGIKAFAAAAAAVFALVQYFDHLQEARVQQTLEFYKRFSSQPLSASRTAILADWESLWPKVATLPPAKTPDEVRALRTRWKQMMVSNFAAKPQLAAETDMLFEFFGALQVCIENKICDGKSARELLRGVAKEFFENNCAYVAHMRFDRKNEEFGAKAAVFAGSRCAAEIFEGS